MQLQSSNYPRLARLSWVVLVGCSLVGCSAGTVQLPASYDLYQAKEGSFQCDAPAGWETRGGGKSKTTPVWAKWTSGPALISIQANSTGLLANAGLQGRLEDPNTPPQWEPVHQLHVAEIKQLGSEYSGYTEIAGSPVVLGCSLGPARLSEFTYSGNFGAAMHGYRVSIVGHERGFKAFCTCPEANWKDLRPVFDTVLASLERGSPQ